MNPSPSYDIAILGGGLAGLTAALQASRSGRSVILFEKAPHLGGRATTQKTDGFYFNQGPHALYRQGHGAKILRELGIRYSGNRASYDGSWVLLNGEPNPLPGTVEGVMNSVFLSAAGKAETLSLKNQLMNGYSTRKWDHRTVREWLETQIEQPEVRALFEGQLRLATYCHEMDRQSAGPALDQMIVAGLDGVDYLDGGWQTLIQALEAAALAEGVTFQTRKTVIQLDFHPHSVSLQFADGDSSTARAVISTLPPSAIARLANSRRVPSLHHWAETLVPIHAACLDVALSRLPSEAYQFAIGLDQPLYYSVHTRSAKLAPEGGVLIQLAKYLKSDAQKSAADVRAELESLMDRFQLGWREVLVHQRFLPRMMVTNAVVTPEGRPSVKVKEIPHLFIAGDWVGPVGMLADTSLVSGRDAADCALDWLQTSGETAPAQAHLVHS